MEEGYRRDREEEKEGFGGGDADDGSQRRSRTDGPQVTLALAAALPHLCPPWPRDPVLAPLAARGTSAGNVVRPLGGGEGDMRLERGEKSKRKGKSR